MYFATRSSPRCCGNYNQLERGAIERGDSLPGAGLSRAAQPGEAAAADGVAGRAAIAGATRDPGSARGAGARLAWSTGDFDGVRKVAGAIDPDPTTWTRQTPSRRRAVGAAHAAYDETERRWRASGA